MKYLKAIERIRGHMLFRDETCTSIINSAREWQPFDDSVDETQSV